MNTTNPNPTPAERQREVSRELRETLANLCHEQWAGWMQYLFNHTASEYQAGRLCAVIPYDLVDRWKRQLSTPYAELSESEQDSDRTEADKFIAVFAAALAATRREALTEAAQVARNAMLNPSFEWREHNLACDVIAAAIEAMRDEP